MKDKQIDTGDLYTYMPYWRISVITANCNFQRFLMEQRARTQQKVGKKEQKKTRAH